MGENKAKTQGVICLKFICEYREFDRNNTLPSIKDNVSTVVLENKSKILQHLKSGKLKCASPAYVVDIFTGKQTNIELCIYSDGVYAWSSEMMYYFEKYNLELSQEFIDFVLKK